jgi:uncharacterized protein (TIGR02246 family)
MSVSRKMLLAAGMVLMAVGVFRMKAASSDGARQKKIEAFNKKFVELHLRMDTAGVLALWAEDGVDLMPGEAPLVGKKTIVAWVEAIVAKMPGYEVKKEEVEFHDIQVFGDWASEWATEHQVVQPPEGKPPIEGYGKMMLVLHREANGEWKIKQEMWNAAPRP